jgi:small GTP-binding protein
MQTRDKGRVCFKAVLLGDSGVGKTSLATRWTTGTYSPSSKTTLGANHHRRRLTLEGEDVDLFLWDTAGQEQFQALTPLYARSAAVAILTTSILDPQSFRSIDQWISVLQSGADDLPPLVLAVNKIDRRESGFMTADEIQREYSKRFEGVFLVSALSNEEVDNLFMFAAIAGFRFTKEKNRSSQKGILSEKNIESRQCC